MNELLTRDYGATLVLIWEIIQDPASRPTEAFLIFAIVVILLIMLMLAVLSFVARKPADDRAPAMAQVPGEAEPVGAENPSRESVEPVRRTRPRLPAALVVLGAILVWWPVTGLTTMPSLICESCHVDHVHSLATEPDPHEGVACYRCHEAGGYLAGLTTAVPGRVAHVLIKMVDERAETHYGYAASTACASCHGSQISVTTTNETKAVRISHKEPLGAGAECTDCHRIRGGVIGSYTTGMVTCLRCHDNLTASAECSLCHIGDIALAITGRSEPTTETARRLVLTPDCGGCHDQTACDSCHGIRLPHTQEFMAYAHAREGVEDIWYNGGRTCAKCHNDASRPCTLCHKGRFPSHGTKFAPIHSNGSPTGVGCDNCHAEMSYRPGRNFCELCH